MNISNKTISIAFIVVLIVTVGVSVIGMSLMSRQPMVLQGQVEATEIRISGKLPGRVDSFLVQEGDWVKAGDTLVVINSPTIEAKYRQVNALEQVAQEQNKKIDAGTRRQIIATALQLWNKTQSDLTLAQTTYQRILTLYKDSVVTSQRKDEVEAMYKAAQAAERAAYQQYQMAVDGAQSEDRAAARSLVDAARSTVDEVSALLGRLQAHCSRRRTDSHYLPQARRAGGSGHAYHEPGGDERCTRSPEHPGRPDATVQNGRHFQSGHSCPRQERHRVPHLLHQSAGKFRHLEIDQADRQLRYADVRDTCTTCTSGGRA